MIIESRGICKFLRCKNKAHLFIVCSRGIGSDILLRMSAFLTVVKFFAFDLPGRGGESPNSALLIVQLLSRLIAELFTRDKFRHEVHILSSMAVG